MTDQHLLRIYMKGFMDELNDTYSEIEYEGLELVAYNLGSTHAVLSEPNPLEDDVIKIIRG